VKDHSLSVSPGGKVSLGLGVTAPHAGDNVSVTISGLPTYETITDKLDGKTFSGSDGHRTRCYRYSGNERGSDHHCEGSPGDHGELRHVDIVGWHLVQPQPMVRSSCNQCCNVDDDFWQLIGPIVGGPHEHRSVAPRSSRIRGCGDNAQRSGSIEVERGVSRRRHDDQFYTERWCDCVCPPQSDDGGRLPQ
jgi:hypothetical protein